MFHYKFSSFLLVLCFLSTPKTVENLLAISYNWGMKKNNQYLFLILTAALLVIGLVIYAFLFKLSESIKSTQKIASALDEVTLFTEPDDSRKPILDGIEKAKKSIDIEVYIFTDSDIFNALFNAKKRGVNVRVMLEENPYNSYGANKGMKDKLSHYGIINKWSNRVYQYTHSKFLVIDESTGYIMTLNLSKSALTKNREFGIITEDSTIIAELEKIFEADWTRKPYNPSNSPLVVSPENSRNKISSLINSASSELIIYDEELEDKSIENLIEKKATQGVKVYVIVADPVSVSSNKDVISEFKKYGIDIRYVSSPFIHAKAIVVDKKTGYIGSVNLTDTSFDKNREVGVMIDDPKVLTSVRETFFNDFTRGR